MLFPTFNWSLAVQNEHLARLTKTSRQHYLVRERGKGPEMGDVACQGGLPVGPALVDGVSADSAVGIVAMADVEHTSQRFFTVLYEVAIFTCDCLAADVIKNKAVADPLHDKLFDRHGAVFARQSHHVHVLDGDVGVLTAFRKSDCVEAHCDIALRKNFQKLFALHGL